MKHVMTFDIEAWFHGNFKNYVYRQYLGKVDDLVIPQTNKLLDLLDKTYNKAVFFILGEIADMHPGLVREIHSRGHEIASHFMHHDLIYEMSIQKFRIQLKESVDKLQQLVGSKIAGFRAPSWSVDVDRTPWFWELLIEEGLLYSSSRFPFKTYMYGDDKSSLYAHRIKTKAGCIWEIPPSCIRLLGRNIPFSGGVFFRALPEPIIKMGIKWYVKQHKPVVFYMHPSEIAKDSPRLPSLEIIDKIIYRINKRGLFAKLNRLLSSINTISIMEFLQIEEEDAF